MAFDADQLSALAAVVHEGSFDAAAQRLHVTPSAVSQRIKALEQQVGRVLVLRTRPCRPTEDGEVLVRLAGQMELLGRDAMAQLVPAPGGVAGRTVDAPAARRRERRLDVHVVPRRRRRPARRRPARPAARGPGPVRRPAAGRHRDGRRHRRSARGAGLPRPPARRDAVPGRRGTGPSRTAGSPTGWARRSSRRRPLLAFNREDGLQERFVASVVGRRTVTPHVHYVPSQSAFVGLVEAGLGWGMVPEVAARRADRRGGAGRDPGRPPPRRAAVLAALGAAHPDARRPDGARRAGGGGGAAAGARRHGPPSTAGVTA